MTTKQRRELLQQVRELTNHGRHLEAKALYDEVMADFRNTTR